MTTIDFTNSTMEYDYVTKRDGSNEEVSFDKILRRIKTLSKSLTINSTKVTREITSQMYNGINTSELDELGAQTAASLSTEHPDYGILASRIIISNHHKNTSPSFSETVRTLYENVDKNNNNSSLVSKELYEIVQKNKAKLNDIIKYDRDFLFDYFGFKTLEKSYLMRVNGKIIERPQHLLMRVALGIHGKNIKEAIKTYDLMSNKYFIHATPTLFNAGTSRPQLSSCFLMAMKDDSIDGIYSTLKDCALISKWAGGIGLHVHNIRAKNSIIRGTNGISNGLVPMLRVFNNTARYVDQGGGKRNGSIAIYLEPWHSDIFDFLLLRKNHGNEEDRARDLFYAMWVSDLFMERVKENGDWTLMCPDECPNLSDLYGEEFKDIYCKYERDGRGKRVVKAQELWFAILESQIETGTPYLLFKDACNRKSNQQNLGTIKSSNLCCEIVEYSSPTEFAVCNLASIALSSYVNLEDKTFDYEKLGKIVKVVTRNLDKIIDVNFYPIPETRRSNMLHRPIGIGVQGLADVFAMMEFPFDSEEAREVNKKIFETIYYYAMETSMEISKKRESSINKLRKLEKEEEPNKKEIDKLNEELSLIPEETARTRYLGAYSSFEGSPLSVGKFQFDLWDESEIIEGEYKDRWEKLRKDVMKYGTRNSLLVAPMPTASTSQILGNNECFEPFTSNIYLRRTLAGEFVVINRHLIRNLLDINLWSTGMKNRIIKDNGSIQNIDEIPDNLKQIYKTTWELSNKAIIDMASDRGKFICQSQSMNLFIDKPDFSKLSSMHFYSWKSGLKTGIYYLRTKPVAAAQQFTIEPEKRRSGTESVESEHNSPGPSQAPSQQAVMACRRDNPDCLMCGS